MGSFSLTHWVIFGVIAFGIYSMLKGGSRANGPAVHCMTCGVDAASKTRTRGSIGLEIVLWLCLIVPGLIYSVWRLTTRRQVCSACGAENIIPLDSPAAVSHRRAMEAGSSPS